MLVLAQNEVNMIDVTYGDVEGVSYEFPARYLDLIKPGVKFVYYRGRRRINGKSTPQVYFGMGTIGAVTEHGSRYKAKVLNYTQFEVPVSFKTDEDEYVEPGANDRRGRAVGLYFQTGVRQIDEQTYNYIVSEGLSSALLPEVDEDWSGLESFVLNNFANS